MPIPNWSAALNEFAILFDVQVPTGGLNQNSRAHKLLRTSGIAAKDDESSDSRMTSTLMRVGYML
jgi:hypothetical protein